MFFSSLFLAEETQSLPEWSLRKVYLGTHCDHPPGAGEPGVSVLLAAWEGGQTAPENLLKMTLTPLQLQKDL